MKLREFVENADAQIIRMFREKSIIYPMYHFIDGDDQTAVMAAPSFDDKTLAVAIVRSGFELLRVKRYVFVTEAWTMTTGDKAEHNRIRSYMENHSLEHQPGRKEVLMYSAEDEAEGSLMGMREIIRKGKKPTLGPLDIHPPDGLEGRMVGLLPKKGTAH